MPYYNSDRSAGMSSTFEKSVKGGTKVKMAPPKSKYVEHILLATQSGEAGVAEVFRTLTHRLRDSTWTVAFKSLIIVHLMIKEGAKDVTLSYLSSSPKSKLAINHFTDVQTQGQNIRRYAEYLLSRAQAYGASKTDYVRSGEGRMKQLSVDKGLLRETEIVQSQVRTLIHCDLLSTDVENEISLTAFRLLTRDLLDLYNVLNEAVMNVLSHYFEMSRTDAERAIKIYQKFCTQTTEVVQYLSVARQYEHATRLEIPKIKHAPTSLAKSLQEYLDDPNFEVNRRQYLAEQEAKRSGKPVQRVATSKAGPATSSTAPQAKAPEAPTATSSQPAKGPAPDLIDFFESIEQNQEPMAQYAPQFQPQQTGFQQQAFGYQQAPQQPGYEQSAFTQNGTNPFMQMQLQQQQQQPPSIQTHFTDVGFGGYGQPPQQQQPFMPTNAFAPDQQYTSPVQTQSPAQFIPPQQTGSTNPFRQSSMPTGAANVAFNNQIPQRTGTNPFARNTSSSSPVPLPSNTFAAQAHSTQHNPNPSPSPQPQTLQAQPTGTNPFARKVGAAQTGLPQQPTPPISPSQGGAGPMNALQVQQTGSTNPFRQSAFVNTQTGQGWQNAPQTTMGGWENLETIPVFPRPGQSTPLL